MNSGRPRSDPISLMSFGWLILAVVASLQGWVRGLDEPRPMSLLQATGLEAPGWLLWIGVTPLVARISATAGRTRLALRLTAHGLLFGLTLAVNTTLSVLVLFTLFPIGRPLSDFGQPWVDLALIRSLPVGATYAMVVAILTAKTYYERLRVRELQTAEAEARRSRAELEALRARIQPHFLFNALQAISTLIESDPSEARRVTRNLSKVLRAAVDGPCRDRSTLGEELEVVQAYLDVEHARFPDRLSLSIDVPHDLLEVALPPLLLQPLVENAIVHGIAPRSRAGTVSISGVRENGQLLLVVADDGVGLAPAPREGVGLSVTRERIALHYQGRATLDVRGASGNGTVAELRIPLDGLS